MDYFLKSQMNIETAEQLALLLALTDSLKRITLKRGQANRLVVPGQTAETFSIQLRTKSPKEIRDLYKGFTEFLVENNVGGMVAWHECRHQEKDTPCVWNETFYHPPLGGEG